MERQERDHGGGLDAAAARWGGSASEWLDLSTGINPVPYPLPALPKRLWTRLPDTGDSERLIEAARRFWRIPPTLDVMAANGASALIAAMPALGGPAGRVLIPGPTYNEHGAAFAAQGWTVVGDGSADARVIVHPNNPDGRFFAGEDLSPYRLTVIDESFCDPTPLASLQALAHRPGTVVLKGLGKFWGLAGVRLGFAIGRPETLAPLRDRLGPWAVSGPALVIGAAALGDPGWAEGTRARLTADAGRLDALMTAAGARTEGGTPLFRLYSVEDAARWQARLAEARIWTRIFPYSATWIRLGLPGTDGDWARLAAALGVTE